MRGQRRLRRACRRHARLMIAEARLSPAGLMIVVVAALLLAALL